jgi:hypothetical protein
MKGKNEEAWRQLCALAAREQDPEKLMALIAEIDRMLGEKMKRLRGVSTQSSDDTEDPSG